MSIKLETINRLIGWLGIVLVVEIWDEKGPWQPTRLHVWTKSRLRYARGKVW